MFSGCESLESLDLSNFDTDGFSHLGRYHIGGMFENCNSLRKLVISSTFNVTADMKLVGRGSGFCGWANENNTKNLMKAKIATFSGAGTYIHVK